jgi:hypothetical protein
MHEENPWWWTFGVIWLWIIWRLRVLSKRLKHRSQAKIERATNLMEIIHSDVCSPLCVAACGGFFYFIFFHQWFEWIYMDISIWWERSMKYLKGFKEFQHEVEIHRNKKIKYLWLDHKGEYLSYEFSKHLRVEELFHKLASPETSQECEVFERCSRTLLDMVRSMMLFILLPL